MGGCGTVDHGLELYKFVLVEGAASGREIQVDDVRFGDLAGLLVVSTDLS